MKRLIFFFGVFLTFYSYAQMMKKISVGKLEARIFDDGIQSATNLPMSHCIYVRGYYTDPWDWLETTTYWPGGMLRNASILVGCRNWIDTLGNRVPYYVTGHCNRESYGPGDPYQFNVPFEDGLTIHRYSRYPPPVVKVDKELVSPPWGFRGDVVDSTKVWGTADMMVECHWRLSIGMDVYQRNLAWSQPDHDDYVIWDLTFVNTGNTDRDEEIELPGQRLDSVVIMRHYEALPNGGLYPFGSWAGVTEDHNSRLSYPFKGDSLRINYVALARKGGMNYDTYGHKCSVEWGGNPELLDGCGWTGHVILFAPKNPKVPQTYPISNPQASNDPAQPSMHSTIEGFYGVVYNLQELTDSSEFRQVYRCMRMGIRGYDDTTKEEVKKVHLMNEVYDVYDTTATGAPTYYYQPQDRMGEKYIKRGAVFPRDWAYYTFCTAPKFSIGPYNMEYGDTIRFVFAVVAGAIHRKTSYELSRYWISGKAREYGWLKDMEMDSIKAEYLRRDPVAEIYTPISAYRKIIWPGINAGGVYTWENDCAKDYVVSTGKDSLFKNGLAAQRNFNMNYNIPPSPPPPKIFNVNSSPEGIKLSWSYDTDPSNLGGFKIYRAMGGTLYKEEGGVATGDWQLIDSLGPEVREYIDTIGIVRGYDYYYSITAISTSGVESGKWLTMTQEPFAARLLDPPGMSLDEVRVVPNPLNTRLGIDRSHFSDDQYKITFRHLPPICTIRIFTESGELVKTIEHTNGSGTEFWQEYWYLTTINNQRPASGIYIAHIQTPDGKSIVRKFIIIR
ncbi:MAG: hypothetical protein ABIN61_04470 [candidate division WOR-3 bacterium]